MHPTLPLQPQSSTSSSSHHPRNSITTPIPPGPGGDASWYDSMLTKLGKQPEWHQDKEQSLLEPYSYLSSVPGKEVRSQLIDAFNLWLKVPHSQLQDIKRVTRMLHTASLLMDDVEDNSTLRRGIPVAHKIYGIPQTINCANYVYFQVFQEIQSLENSLKDSNSTSTSTSEEIKRKSDSISNLVTSELLNLHRGQGMDLFWRDSLICPTEEEYVEMVNNKTGGLFRIALGLMCKCSQLYKTQNDESEDPDDEEPDLIPLANLIGLLFQIRDDFMNLESKDYADNKGFAEDLTEGKFSFPIIHGIRSSVGNSSNPSSSTSSNPFPIPSSYTGDFQSRSQKSQFDPSSDSGNGSGTTVVNRQLLNILSQKPTDESIKLYAVNYMKEVTGSLDYTRDVLRRLDRLAREEVVRIGGKVERKWKVVDADGDRMEGIGDNKGLLMILDALRKGWWNEEWD